MLSTLNKKSSVRSIIIILKIIIIIIIMMMVIIIMIMIVNICDAPCLSKLEAMFGLQLTNGKTRTLTTNKNLKIKTS